MGGGGWHPLLPPPALKNVSGFYIAVYILPRPLYTNMRQSFIYFVATSNIGVKYMTTSDKIILAIWKKTSQMHTKTRRATWSK